MQDVAIFIRVVLASVFLTSAITKIKPSSAFEQATRQLSMGLLGPRLSRFAARVLPLCELVLALSLVTGIWLKLSAGLVFLMLLIFTILMAINLARGNRFRCSCFGAMSKADIGLGSIARNVILLAGSLVLLIASRWANLTVEVLHTDLQYLSDPNTVALLMSGISVYVVLLAMSELDVLFRNQSIVQ